MITYEVKFARSNDSVCLLPSTETCWGEPAKLRTFGAAFARGVAAREARRDPKS